MAVATFLIVHKDHQIDLHGVNSGAETATLWLARTLVKRGDRVVLAAQLKNGSELWNGIECWDLGEQYDIVSALKKAADLGDFNLICACRVLPAMLAKDLKNCRAKILFAHDPSAGAMGIKAALLHHVVDSAVCVSQAQKDLFIKEGAREEIFTVIPNGADLNVFHPRADVRRDPNRIVFAGALVIDKGIDLLINAFQIVKSQNKAAYLDIYGSSQMWGREPLFDPRAVEASVPGIKFHGGVSQAQVAEAFSGAALAAIPSRWFDSFPLTAVEAQACGAPVVAFDVGGVKEAFVPGTTGILVANVNEQELANAMLSLLGNSDRISKMSQAAQQLVQERFTWDKVVDSLHKICSDVCSQSGVVSGRLGLLSTWNQRCGLATYANFLFGKRPQDSMVIFSEEGVELTNQDRSNVKRCWTRSSHDFSDLVTQIQKSKITALHLNLHSATFFDHTDKFVAALKSVRDSGVRLILQLHSTFTSNPGLVELLSISDLIIVHSSQNRLQVLANGAIPDRVVVLPHGVTVRDEIGISKETLRSELDMPSDSPVLLAFGFIQPHKGMEGILEAVYHCRQRGIPLTGWIVGSPNQSDPGSREYADQLVQLAEKLGITQYIKFVSTYVSDDQVQNYLAAADLVLMNYRSQHYEASGACSLAIGAGAVVLTSMAPPFLAFEDAVWHITSGYPVHLSVELLLRNEGLRKDLQLAAYKFAQDHSWKNTVLKLDSIYRDYLGLRVVEEKVAELPEVSVKSNLSVLFQSRPNTYTQRGGDTIVLERTVSSLKEMGVNVVVDLESKEDPANYDIVHLFNFALPSLLKEQGMRAVSQGTPFVVTTLHEDVGMFHAQSHALAYLLIEYIKNNQSKEWWSKAKDLWKTVPGVDGFDNQWVCENAAALLTNGANETASITKRYPSTQQCHVVSLGSEVGIDAGAELFIKEYGVKDFVLCVGRLETRKNQLMLLKALENSDLTVVLAAGGFTYQPDYSEAVRNFKRRGKTIILDRLSPEMLASAYAASAVHVLPSWYELPGLVSLEAARRGRPVVVTDYGTARDYLGSSAFYCNPGDEESIREAIERAINTPVNEELRRQASSFTWSSIGEQTLKVYEQILGMQMPQINNEEGVHMAPSDMNQTMNVAGAAVATPIVSYDFAPDVTKFQELLEQGETAARSGDLAKAKEYLREAEEINPSSVRLLKVAGTVALAENEVKTAKNYFDRAWSVDPKDPRVLCGLGMCELRVERAVDAYRYFVEALSLAPDSEVAILHFIPCAYALDRFDDLEKHLRHFVDVNPSNNEMKYCLAGCLIKMKRFDDAIEIGNFLMSNDSSNARYTELVQVAMKKKDEFMAMTNTTAKPVANKDSEPAEESPHRSLISRAIERISMPESTPQASASDSMELDLEIGNLEEMKHKRQFSDVVQNSEKLLRDNRLSPAQRRIVTCLRAEVAVLEGEFEVGTRMFNQVLEGDPQHSRAICGIAVVAANENKWSEAQNLFQKAALFDERSDVARAGLGLCAWQTGQHSEAWNHFSAAIEMNPENTRALLGLVQIGFPEKRFAEIERAIRAYLEFHPADIDWLYSLAGCCYAQEKLAEAYEAVNQITLFKPTHEKALELREMINKRQSGDSASIFPRA